MFTLRLCAALRTRCAPHDTVRLVRTGAGGCTRDMVRPVGRALELGRASMSASGSGGSRGPECVGPGMRGCEGGGCEGGGNSGGGGRLLFCTPHSRFGPHTNPRRLQAQVDSLVLLFPVAHSMARTAQSQKMKRKAAAGKGKKPAPIRKHSGRRTTILADSAGRDGGTTVGQVVADTPDAAPTQGPPPESTTVSDAPSESEAAAALDTGGRRASGITWWRHGGHAKRAEACYWSNRLLALREACGANGLERVLVGHERRGRCWRRGPAPITTSARRL